MSDNFRSQVLCQPPDFRNPDVLTLSVVAFPHLPTIPRLPQFKLGDTLLRLVQVVHRKPVPYRPYEHVPDYLLCYVIETLACGHQLTTYPAADPLIAVRRDCKDCGSNLIEFPSPKPKRKEKAA